MRNSRPLRPARKRLRTSPWCVGRGQLTPVAVLMTGLLVVFLLPRPVAAATLTKLDLVLGGSVAPPGDRLDLAVLLLPGEKEITLQIRAFLVSGPRNSRVQPVKAAGRRNRDPMGNFLAAVRCRRGPTSPRIVRHVPIPYAGHRLGPRA